jgi:serine/threonine-protein kinase
MKIMSATVPPGRFAIERERFLREAHAAATLDHPNVVKVHETGYLDEGRHPFSVMEYVEGQNLAKRFDEVFQLELRERARLVKEMTDGLGAIHARFLCHRDMKPQNILITHDFHAKIADLGLVRFEGSNITLDTNLVGTPAFMAPEGFSSPHTDGRADIFSLGIIAYILFVGHRPFIGESIDDMAESIIHGLPADPLEDDPAFPLNLRDILGRMLDKRPEHRFQNCGELSSALAGYLEHGPTRSRLFQHLRLRRVWR